MLDALQVSLFLTDYFIDIFHACFRNRVVKIWVGVGKRIITHSGMEINRNSHCLGQGGEFRRELGRKLDIGNCEWITLRFSHYAMGAQSMKLRLWNERNGDPIELQIAEHRKHLLG